MSTTSLKLPEDLKARAAAVARKRGTTVHAFLVDAVRQATTAAEKRASFVADAVAARKELDRTGKGYVAEEVHAYIRAKLRGQRARRPKAKSWRA